jgi:hypothetical protein
MSESSFTTTGKKSALKEYKTVGISGSNITAILEPSFITVGNPSGGDHESVV